MRFDTFFDTWAWVAIVDKNDTNHAVADKFYRQFLSQGHIPVTSDYIISETLTLLRRRVASNIAILFGDILFKSISVGRIKVENINYGRWEKIWRLFKKFSDKPDISVVDLSSMVIMEEIGIKNIFSGDEHFEYIGMGFIRVP
ncbi:MAG: PIN domain-containing protein [Candidatus Eremiobacterota bacterium]